MSRTNYDHLIQRIREALHDPSGSKASVLVGAGFSLNAERRYPGVKGYPTWSELTEQLVQKIYPTDLDLQNRALKQAGVTSGALRLAQEFEVSFGRTALVNLVRDALPDGDYEPGDLHKDLLKLPWADVYTTNFDTLLERASKRLRDKRYDIVLSARDLPLKRSPRIVKLHGTLPELRDLVLTEEDFRTYHERHAPYLAEVQSAMVRNHFCLLGFSGDDPNFLAWSGWVRDRLRDQTLPLYLWTFQELAPSKARLLEQRMVHPIPMSVVTQEAIPGKAVNAFIKLLREPLTTSRAVWCLPPVSKPEMRREETLTRIGPAEENEDGWIAAAEEWKANRDLYPGWHIPHSRAIEDLWSTTRPWHEALEAAGQSFDRMDPAVAVFVLSELLWRLRKCLIPISTVFANVTIPEAVRRYSEWRSEFDKTCDGRPPQQAVISLRSKTAIGSVADLDDAATDLLLEQLRHFREGASFEQFESASERMGAALEKQSARRDPQFPSEQAHFLLHERCLSALAQWDDAALLKWLEEWDTSASPHWALRKAGIQIERGMLEEGESNLRQAFKELRGKEGPGTPEAWSIESWIVYRLRQIENTKEFVGPARQEHDFSSDKEFWEQELSWLQHRDCNPGEIYRWIHETCFNEDEVWRREVVQKGFDPLAWSVTVRGGERTKVSKRDAAVRAIRFIEQTGFFTRYGNMLFSMTLMRRAAATCATFDVHEAGAIALRMREVGAIAEWLPRYRVASLAHEEAIHWARTARRGIQRDLLEGDRIRQYSAKEREIRAAIVLLSRVAVRLGDVELEGLLWFVFPVLDRLSQWELFNVAGEVTTLLKRILASMSQEKKKSLLTQVPSMSVPEVDSLQGMRTHLEWPDPVIYVLNSFVAPKMIEAPSELAAHVDALLDQLSDVSSDLRRPKTREYFCRRLARMTDRGLLSRDQVEVFRTLFFSQTDDGSRLPINTGMLDSSILMFSDTADWSARAMLRQEYVLSEWPDELEELSNVLYTLCDTVTVRRTRTPDEHRFIAWSESDILLILDRCADSLRNIARQVGRLNVRTTRKGFNAVYFFGDSQQVVEKNQWKMADLLNALVFQYEAVEGVRWDKALKIVEAGEAAGVPLLVSYPFLATFEPSYGFKLECEVLAMLSKARSEHSRFVLHLIEMWIDFAEDSRVPRVPLSVVGYLLGALEGRVHEGLALVCDALSLLIGRGASSEAAFYAQRIRGALELWLDKLEYTTAEYLSESAEIFPELPDIRVSVARLILTLQGIGESGGDLDEWLENARQDPLPEMQQLFVLAGEM